MTLEDIRRAMRERAGAIKAFALRWATIETLVAELGVKGTQRSPLMFSSVPLDITVFDIPVIVVWDTQPEGVIV